MDPVLEPTFGLPKSGKNSENGKFPYKNVSLFFKLNLEPDFGTPFSDPISNSQFWVPFSDPISKAQFWDPFFELNFGIHFRTRFVRPDLGSHFLTRTRTPQLEFSCRPSESGSQLCCYADSAETELIPPYISYLSE